MLNLDAIRDALQDHFPQWTSWIERLPIEEGSGPFPADNDGRSVLLNRRLMSYCTDEIQRFYVAQQMLHLRLSHYDRGRDRDRRAWRRATDAVVNRMLRDDGFQLPLEATLLADSSERSAEELYEIILASLRETGDPAPEQDLNPDDPRNQKKPQPERKPQAGKNSEGAMREIEDPGLAAAVRGLSSLLEPSFQLDYDWFPGDVIRDGLLAWQFKPYPVAHAEILLDTSASVDTELLRSFVKGVKALMQEDAVIRVGCFDTRFYGFHEIRRTEDIDALELRGAGGTNFTAAVNAFTGDAENCIVFTDGYAEMPEQRCDAIWVVYGNTPIKPPGGRVIYAKPAEEKEKHEIDFLIT